MASEITDCSCDGFKEGMPKLNMILSHAIIDHQFKWTSEYFKYCPWCGMGLQTKKQAGNCIGMCEVHFAESNPDIDNNNENDQNYFDNSDPLGLGA